VKEKCSEVKAPEEFERLYVDLKRSNEEELEKLRKKSKKIIFFRTISIILLIISYMAFKAKCDFNIVGPLIALTALFIIICFDLNHGEESNYKYIYKENIVKRFLYLLNPQFTYDRYPERYNPKPLEKEYTDSCFTNNYNKFNIDDYIEGYIKEGTFIKMGDVRIASKSKKSEIVLFNGMFAVLNTRKNINSYVKITKNSHKIFEKEDKVMMDYSEFEKYFDVHSEDPILTMRILTADIMEYLVDFYKKYNLPFEIAFLGKYIYLRFFTGPMFEPSIRKDSMNKTSLLKYYSIVEFISEVSNLVNDTIKDLEI
jgi:hypothetical protein